MAEIEFKDETVPQHPAEQPRVRDTRARVLEACA